MLSNIDSSENDPNLRKKRDDEEVQTPIKSNSTLNSNRFIKQKTKIINGSTQEQYTSLDFYRKETDMRTHMRQSPDAFKNLHNSISITKKQPQNTDYEDKQNLINQSKEIQTLIVSNFDDNTLQKQIYNQYLTQNPVNQNNLQLKANKIFAIDQIKEERQSYINKSESDYKCPVKTKRSLSISNKSKKVYGINTIYQKDYLPIEDTILNYKKQIISNMGQNKKIYLRADKLDYIHPAQQIFEQRELQNKEKIKEDNINQSVNYLQDLKIKPYQRKCRYQYQEINISSNKIEELQEIGLDPSDLSQLIQKQYNKCYLTNLYVTGSLSIIINNKKNNKQKKVMRKIQNQKLLKQENENQEEKDIIKEYFKFNQLSKRSHISNKNKKPERKISIIESSRLEIGSDSRASNQGTGNRNLKRSRTSIGNQIKQVGLQPKKSMKIINDEPDLTNLSKRKRLLSKKAQKDEHLRKMIIVSKMTKDAVKSQNFKHILLKAKHSENKTIYFNEIIDSDDDKQNEQLEEDFDEFLDIDFDCNIEILKSKNNSRTKKIDQIQWSGQDVLLNFDPQQAINIINSLQGIKIWPNNILRYILIIKSIIKKFITGSFVENIMTFSVIFNTVCLAIDRPTLSESDKIKIFLIKANNIFTYVFASEMCLKIIGLGVVKYLKDRMNYLDGTIVILSLVEVSITNGGSALSAFRSIRIFRTFRVLRITRLLRTMKQMSVILNALIGSLNKLLYLFMLVFLMIFIFSLIGMSIFGGQMFYQDNNDGHSGIPRQNYSSFYWAFQVTFQLLTQENWQIVLFDTLRAPINKGLTMVYHIAWMTVGNTILLNLLMGIMLDSLGEEDQIEEKQDKIEDLNKHINDIQQQQGQQLIEYFQASKQSDSKSKAMFGEKKKKKKKQKNDNILDESFEFDQEEQNKITMMKKGKENFEENECQISFYIFSKSNPLRIFLYNLHNQFAFEAFIQFVILLSSIKLVVDTYQKRMSPNTPYIPASAAFDIIFTVIFATESLIKSLALGFIMDKGSYLREMWSQLDFFIVVTSLIDASFSSINIPVVKILRLLRTLRPLRVISHNSQMKNIIGALAHSISGIFYVGILLLIVWIMFAILGVSLIGGKLYSCSILPYIYTDETICLENQGTWQNQPFNYDNVGIALISLFDVSTMENWPDQRNAACDISGQNTGPIRNNSLAYSYFFIAFIMIGTYIFLNLFIGVIFIKFQKTQQEEKEQSNLNDDQQRWMDMMDMIIQAEPDLETTNIPKNKFRKIIHSFVTGISMQPKQSKIEKIHVFKKKSTINYNIEKQQEKENNKQKIKKVIEYFKNVKKFDTFITIIIVLNLIQLCLNYEGASLSYNKVIDYQNYVFTIIFFIEALLKIIAFGFSYFKNAQNVFDFFIMCTNIADLCFNFISLNSTRQFKLGSTLARIFRVLRVFRLYRFVKKFKGLNAMMDTIMISLGTLMSTFGLLLLVYFIYAVLANFLFGDVTSGQIIDEYTNFNTFGTSMLTLIRASTGEDWNYIMIDCGKTPETNCIPGVTCGSSNNVLFFISFMAIQGFIMLNLFVLIITQQFDKFYMQEKNVLQIFKLDLAKFKEVWTKLTIENNCIKIKDTKIVDFFLQLEEPLGMRPPKDEITKHQTMKRESNSNELKKYLREKDEKLIAQIIKVVVSMDLEIDSEGFIYFNELLFKTLKRVYGDEHIKNKIIITKELKALKKIKSIREFIIRQQRKDIRVKILTVNPFILKMFKHISFKSWVNLYKQNQLKRLRQKETVGEAIISDADTNYNQDQNNDNYEYKTEQDESCSENEYNGISQSQSNFSQINKEISRFDSNLMPVSQSQIGKNVSQLQ